MEKKDLVLLNAFIGSVVLAVGLLPAGSEALAAANLLTNPDFESGDKTGWTDASATTDIITAGWFWGAGPHSGVYGCGTADSGSQKATDIYQELPVSAGIIYDVSGWLRIDNHGSASAQNRGYFTVDWRDGGGTGIQTDTSTIVASDTTPDGTWVEISHSWTAPAGAATARVHFHANAYGGAPNWWGVLVWDDLWFGANPNQPTPTPAAGVGPGWTMYE